jgi:Ribbon-helix-helix protein, copG family
VVRQTTERGPVRHAGEADATRRGAGSAPGNGAAGPRLSTICGTIWPMARREVLVQLDDELVERLDRLADQQGTSRSDLLRRGAAAVLEASELAAADRELQESYRRTPQDPAVVAAATRLAAHTAPEW